MSNTVLAFKPSKHPSSMVCKNRNYQTLCIFWNIEYILQEIFIISKNKESNVLVHKVESWWVVVVWWWVVVGVLIFHKGRAKAMITGLDEMK